MLELPLRGLLRPEQVAAGGVLDALRLAGGPRGVQQEQRVLRLHPFRFARRRLSLADVLPPEVAFRIHGDRLAGALQHDHALYARAPTRERLAREHLEPPRVAAAPATV